MDLITCEYCGMEFSKEHTHCPVCGRSVQPSGDNYEAPIYNKKSGGRFSRGGRYAVKSAKEPKANAASKQSMAEGPEAPAAEKPSDNVYALPKPVMILICVVLGLAVLAGALLAFYKIGYFDFLLNRSSQIAPLPAEEPSRKAGESDYTNEEDYQPEGRPDVQVADPVACMGLTISTTSITFGEEGQFYNISVTLLPENCTDPVYYSSTNEDVATVTDQGKVVAVGGGTADVIATCGDFSETCLVTCDFVTEKPTRADEVIPPALSSTEMTFTFPGQQATLLVNNVDEDAEISFESADESVAAISAEGQITAVGNGTTTVFAIVHDLRLGCAVTCTLDESAESTGPEEPISCTISHADVTMTIKGEYFRLSLKDANDNRVKGVIWTSSDTTVCTVDDDGIVTAVGRGTTTVYTTYGGSSYECIIRCPIS